MMAEGKDDEAKATAADLQGVLDSFNSGEKKHRHFIEVTHSQWHMLMAALKTAAAASDHDNRGPHYLMEFMVWTLVDPEGLDELGKTMHAAHDGMKHDVPDELKKLIGLEGNGDEGD